MKKTILLLFALISLSAYSQEQNYRISERTMLGAMTGMSAKLISYDILKYKTTEKKSRTYSTIVGCVSGFVVGGISAKINNHKGIKSTAWSGLGGCVAVFSLKIIINRKK